MTAWYDQFQFSKARRKEAAKRLLRTMTWEEGEEGLLPLDEVQDRLGLFAQHYGGLRAIPVDKIVGSVGRSHEFDEDFLPRTERLKERWEQLERAYPYGDFPPIEVYQIGDVYFVIDGHHRVGIARQRGIEFLDAEITVLTTEEDIDESTDLGSVITIQQRRNFMKRSGLGRARPDADIRFSRPQGYNQLLERVKIHGFHEMQERGEVMTTEEVAADWYDRIYLPRVRLMAEIGLPDLFSGVTEADLFLMVHQRLHSLFPVRGTATFEDAAKEAAAAGEKTSAAKERVRKATEAIRGD